MGADHHVVVFPWPEQGHINPATSIADYVAAAGIHVTFVHTERSYALMQEASVLDDEAGKRPNFTEEVVPDDSFLSDHVATQHGLDLVLSKLMQRHPCPSCLLVDSFYPWASLLAARHGLARVEIWTAAAYSFTISLHAPLLVDRGFLPITGQGMLEKVIDFIPGLTPFRMADLPKILLTSDLEDPLFKFFTSLAGRSRDADRVLAHTVYEVEHSTIDSLKENAGIRMDPIGPLITAARHNLLSKDPTCMSWLDKQEKGSVLYIAFGSVSVLKEEVLVELAYGLAASGQAFLWVIRPNKDFNAAENKEESMLHEALNVATKEGKGYITSWAPQIEVLGHPAVGAFLSHCGWNSTLESLNVGVPILGFPQGGEQPVNLKCIVNDWKAGLALQEGLKKGESLHRDHVEKVVRAMMVGEEGRQVKEGALEWSKLAHKALLGSPRNNLQRFVDDVKQGRLKISTLS
eukprot:c24658_g1_i1 orf=88-1473(+)